MIPKYYYVVNTDCHPVNYSEFYCDAYLGQISSWHRTLPAAIKAKTRLSRFGINTTAIYCTDFVIRDSEFLSKSYGGAAPEWREPVRIDSF